MDKMSDNPHFYIRDGDDDRMITPNTINRYDAKIEQLEAKCAELERQVAEITKAKIFWATRCTEIEGQLEEVLSGWRRSAMEASLAHGKIAELQDFAIWMTGCGYDFAALPYFCEQRDKLLKGATNAKTT